jgi:hypothetical protein
MGAKQNGPISWNLETIEDIEAPEFEKKYKAVLTELSKFIGAACNTGDIEAFQFLIHYTTLIFQGGYEVLKESFDDKKTKNFEQFLKKMNISKN